MRSKAPWFEIALAAVILSAYLYAARSDGYNLPYRWFIRDDAYYYFKVAQNISEGQGSTFDGIHATNGYHPLWMLICVPVFALARQDLILPLRVLIMVTGALQTATGILLYRLVRDLLSPPVAVLAAAYCAFSSYLLVFLYKTGVESSIALFFILLLLMLLYRVETSWRRATPTRGQLALIAVVATLVLFSRLDLIFFVLIVGMWVMLRESSLRTLLPLDMLAITLSVLAAFLVRLGLPGYYDASGAAVIMIGLALAIKLPVLWAFGLYQRTNIRIAGHVAIRTALAVAAASAGVAAGMVGGNALGLIPAFPKAVLAFDALFTAAGIVIVRAAATAFGMGRQTGEVGSPLDEIRACWRTWGREGGIYYGIVGGSLALYMGWNRLAFGSFTPVSGEIKRWWGTFLTSIYGGPPQNLLAFFGADQYSSFNAWNPSVGSLAAMTNPLLYNKHDRLGSPAWDRNFIIILTIALFVLLLVLLWRRRDAGRMAVQAAIIPLFVGSWLQILSYSATGYASPKEWYWLTQPVLLVLGGAWLLEQVYELMFRPWPVGRSLAWVVAGVLAIGGAAAYWRDALALYPYGKQPKHAAYAEVVPFLEANTPPGSLIGMTGGGNVGYFLHDRVIVNMDGLINSTAYFNDLKAGTSSSYLYQTGMRYVFANPGVLAADPYRGQYEGRLQTIASWGGKDLMKLLPTPAGQ